MTDNKTGYFVRGGADKFGRCSLFLSWPG